MLQYADMTSTQHTFASVVAAKAGGKPAPKPTPSKAAKPAAKPAVAIAAKMQRKVGGAGRPVIGAAFPDANRTSLAEACGVSMGHVCKVLNGDNDPSLQVAGRMAKALGLGMEALMEALERQKRARSKGRG